MEEKTVGYTPLYTDLLAVMEDRLNAMYLYLREVLPGLLNKISSIGMKTFIPVRMSSLWQRQSLKTVLNINYIFVADTESENNG